MEGPEWLCALWRMLIVLKVTFLFIQIQLQLRYDYLAIQET